MEKIIQIAIKPDTPDTDWATIALTNEGRIFRHRVNERWEEFPLPPLHTDEIDHESKGHICSQCVKIDDNAEKCPYRNPECPIDYPK